MGVNAGVSGTGQPSSVGGNVGGGVDKGNQVNNQTHLLIADGENSQITADNTALVGGMLANATRNEDGTLEDHGKLNLTTGTLTVANLEDSRHSNQSGFGVNLSLDGDQNVTSATLNANNSGHEMEGLTQATLGSGNIQVNGQALDDSNSPEGLNRDMADAQITTLDMETGGLNASMTVDGQWLTQAGRDEIIDNHKNFVGNTIQVTAAAATDVAAVTAATGSVVDVAQGRGLDQTVNAFNTTINGKDLAYAEGGAVAGMTEAMRDGDIEDAQAMQDGINDIDAVLNSEEPGTTGRAKATEGAADVDGDPVYGAANQEANAMYVDTEEGRTDSLVNTVAHEGMHLGGAGEVSAHTTGLMTDLSYRLNAYANKDQINENRPAPIAIQDPAANAALLASNNAEFGELAAQRNVLQYRPLHEQELEFAQRIATEETPYEVVTATMREMSNSELGESANHNRAVKLEADATPESVADQYYDYEADWAFYPDSSGEGGVLVQQKGEIDPDAINLIRQESGGDDSPYTIADQELEPKNQPNVPQDEQDRLTGRVLDENGQYTVTRIVENVPYDLKAFPCATPECIAVEANIDTESGDYPAWSQASNTKTLKDASTAATVAAMATPAGWATYTVNSLGFTTGLFAAHREGELADFGTQQTIEHTVEFALDKSKVPEHPARIITNLIGLSGVDESAVGQLNLPNSD